MIKHIMVASLVLITSSAWASSEFSPRPSDQVCQQEFSGTLTSANYAALLNCEKKNQLTQFVDNIDKNYQTYCTKSGSCTPSSGTDFSAGQFNAAPQQARQSESNNTDDKPIQTVKVNPLPSNAPDITKAKANNSINWF